jgi:hypothetical protein
MISCSIKNRIFTILLASILFIPTSYASKEIIPDPFRGETRGSKLTINYADIDELLDASVLYLGRSQRTKAKKSTGNIGTRLKVRVNKLTALEGNRFYFEAFKGDNKSEALTKIRKSLEAIPTEAPLNLFTKEEQLAYWLNLYNITMIDEIMKVYPQSKLKDFLTDNDSILNDKILTVSGIKLSLNDIHHKILMPKYNNDPLIMYGLFQGIIGGPNIRKSAYTGKKVYSNLEDNANEFVNSNRGTYASKKSTMRVSSLYKRNAEYFPNFKNDLRAHLLKHIEGYTRYQLEESSKIKANINDWKIVDLYGSTRKFGGSAATNKSALIDSVANNTISTTPGTGVADLSLASSYYLQKGAELARFSPEQLEILKQINETRAINTGNVTVTDLDTIDSEKKK